MVIIFDLGKVILDFDHRTITRRLGERSSVPEDRVQRLIFGGELEGMYDRGEIGSEDFHRRVVASLGADIPFEEFRAIWTQIFVLNQEVCQVIRRLKERHRLLLLSNTNEMHFEHALGVFEILRLFDDYVLSYRVGERKPNPRIYLTALRKASCPAEPVCISTTLRSTWQRHAASGCRRFTLRTPHGSGPI
jgi:FMN phosphatase YigB (HAD superfamily)